MTDYKGISGNCRALCSTPTYERIKQLWILGNSPTAISIIINEELSDLEANTITPGVISQIIGSNLEDFHDTRGKIGLKCQDAIREQVSVMFNIVRQRESRLVTVFADKLEVVLNQLSELDIDEKDDDGSFKNTSRFFVLYEMADKLQSKISRITGSDALREIEVFKQKLELKTKIEGKEGLIPDFKSNDYKDGETVDVTNFI